MKLVVVSPESAEPREICVVHALFAAGLERYHLRKPTWTAPELESWLRNFSPEERARIVIHTHHELALQWGLEGIHERDNQAEPQNRIEAGFQSRACHDLETLRTALGRYDAVLVSPIFPSISKPGYEPTGDLSLPDLQQLLSQQNTGRLRTAVFALGGIDISTTPQCCALGFDGVAVLGAVWNSPDPVGAFSELKKACEKVSALVHQPIMCLTQDGLPWSHPEQARRLCAAGAGWIQLRMKGAEPSEWLKTACEVSEICRKYHATLIVNDSVDIALAAGADGVHLGKLDLNWTEARRRLGSSRILGGTVNNSFDAAQARASGCLDYVGVGPWRFTANKENLAPILGAEGVSGLIKELGPLPAWVIGGVETSDLSAILGTGAAGVAVSSALFRQGVVEENFGNFKTGWTLAGEVKAAGPRPSRATRAALSVTTL